MKKRFFALMLAMVAIFAVACSNGGGKTDGGTKTSGKDSGGEQYINSSMDNEPTTLDAQKGNDIYGNYIINNIYEPLLRIREKDGNLEIEEAGAEKYEVSDDGLTYTFHLRDFTWEDGQAVTAKDYEYGIKRCADPNTGSDMAFLLAPIENFDAVNSGEKPLDDLGVKALDDKTLEIKLKAPTGYFLRLVPFRVMLPQRQDMVEKHKEQFGSEADTVIGCGPFKIESWTHNSELILAKSDTYWDKDTVQLSKVNYKIMTDVNTIMNALDVGEVDLAQTNLKEWTDKFDKNDKMYKNVYSLPQVSYLALNTKDKLLQNQKIRQAISIALDRDGINEQVYQGAVEPAYRWVPKAITLNGQPYADKTPEPIKEMQKANPDPKKLFAEGLKELGITTPPEKINLEFQMTNTPLLKSLGEFAQANLKEALGVNVTLNMMEWPVLNTNITKGEYQIGFLGWYADYDDPHAMLSLFTSSAAAVNTGWSNEEYDKLIDQASSESDYEKATQLYAQAEKMLLENAPVVPILNTTTNKYRYNYVKNANVSDFATTGWKYTTVEGR